MVQESKARRKNINSEFLQLASFLRKKLLCEFLAAAVEILTICNTVCKNSVIKHLQSFIISGCKVVGVTFLFWGITAWKWVKTWKSRLESQMIMTERCLTFQHAASKQLEFYRKSLPQPRRHSDKYKEILSSDFLLTSSMASSFSACLMQLTVRSKRPGKKSTQRRFPENDRKLRHATTYQKS